MLGSLCSLSLHRCLVLDGNLHGQNSWEMYEKKKEGLAGGLASPLPNNLGLVSLESYYCLEL